MGEEKQVNNDSQYRGKYSSVELNKMLNEAYGEFVERFSSFAPEISKITFTFDYTGKITTTAATDGKKIYFYPEFLADLTFEQRLFLMAHEFFHVKFKHVERERERLKQDGDSFNHNVWNIATDAIINEMLSSIDGLPIIEGGVNYPEAKAYTAEEYYDILMQKREEHYEQNPPQHGSQGGGNQQQNGNQQGQQGGGGGQQQNDLQQGERNQQSGGDSQEQNNSQQGEGNGGQSGEDDKKRNKKKYGNQPAGSSDDIDWEAIDKEGSKSSDHRIWKEEENKEESDNSGDKKDKESKDKSDKESSAENSEKVDKKEKQNKEDSEDKDNKADEDKNNQQNSDQNGDSQNKSKQPGNGAGSKDGVPEDNNTELHINERELIDKRRQEKQTQLDDYRRTQVERQSADSSSDEDADYGEGIDIGQASHRIKWKDFLVNLLPKQRRYWDARRAPMPTRQDPILHQRRASQEIKEERKLVIMIDVSGSVDKNMVLAFLREVKGLLDEKKTKEKMEIKLFIGFFDTKTWAPKEYTARDLEPGKFHFPKGYGGGTDMIAALDGFNPNDKSEVNRIVFTDGGMRDDYREKHLRLDNVLWLCYDRDPYMGRPTVGDPFGKNKSNVIFVDTSEDLKYYNNFLKSSNFSKLSTEEKQKVVEFASEMDKKYSEDVDLDEREGKLIELVDRIYASHNSQTKKDSSEMID